MTPKNKGKLRKIKRLNEAQEKWLKNVFREIRPILKRYGVHVTGYLFDGHQGQLILYLDKEVRRMLQGNLSFPVTIPDVWTEEQRELVRKKLLI